MLYLYGGKWLCPHTQTIVRPVMVVADTQAHPRLPELKAFVSYLH
jgi:hypothetical protein